MLETARILAGISAIALFWAIAAAISPSGRQQLRRLDDTTAVDGRHLQIAAYLLMAALGLSAVAASLAIAGWFAN
jgi:hypothetical protein